VFSGTTDGKIYDTYWGGGTSLGTSQEASGLGAVNSVDFANIGGVYNVFSGTASGTVNDTYWGNGTTLGTSQEASGL